MKASRLVLALAVLLVPGGGLLPGMQMSVSADGFIIIPPPPPHRPLPPRPPRPLSITYHRVKTTITGQVATVEVDQEFHNHNPWDVEGIYMFPIPENAAVSGFAMYMDGRKVEGEVLDHRTARSIYEDIVRQMRDPALLEYVGRDMFRASVYPIPANGSKRITLSYNQPLEAKAGLVEFVYPLDTERFSAEPIRDVSVDVEINSRVPVKSVFCPSHEVDIVRHGETGARITYEAHNVKPDKDLVLYYTISKEDVAVNLLTHRNSGEDGFFLLMIAPDLETKTGQEVPKTVLLTLDTSGSMQGEKLAQAKAALNFCLESLNRSDRFALVRFSTEAEILSGGVVNVDTDQKARMRSTIDGLQARGGTNIADALRLTAELGAGETGRPVMALFLTDGLPTVGEKNLDKLLAIGDHQWDNVSLFTFGVGYDVNTHLLDKLADRHRG
ncbi:VWA domain-containing protein, partial [bacterium]|nr:VWA domain-containing protein [candidate division CSSED10-310 bacterium]